MELAIIIKDLGTPNTHKGGGKKKGLEETCASNNRWVGISSKDSV